MSDQLYERFRKGTLERNCWRLTIKLFTVEDKDSEVASIFVSLSLSLTLDNLTWKNSFSLSPSICSLPSNDLHVFIFTRTPKSDVRTISTSIFSAQLNSEIQEFNLLLVHSVNKLQPYPLLLHQLTNTCIILTFW